MEYSIKLFREHMERLNIDKDYNIKISMHHINDVLVLPIFIYYLFSFILDNLNQNFKKN